MEETPERSNPYGTWPSPISAEMVASADIEFGHLALDGDTVYWREQRPDEGGRGVIVRDDGTSTDDITPAEFDVRTLVHEYGGGDFAVHDGDVFFARYDDQRLYRQPVGGDPVPITPEPTSERGLRYAAFEVTADGQSLYCVREDHDIATGDGGPDEPETTLVRLATDGDEVPHVVASGHDFYATPRLSPGGDRLAWLTWDHPRMPWDGTELHVADITPDWTLDNERVVMGGPAESVFQPEWRPDGTLHAVSDRTGWWNLYRRTDDEWVVYREEAAEYGVPQWVFGLATYAFLDDGRVAVLVTRNGQQTLEFVDPDGTTDTADLPFETYSARLRSDDQSLYLLAAGPRMPWRLVRWRPGADPVVVRRAGTIEFDEAYISQPESVTFPTRDRATAHAFVYPPTNPDVDSPPDELPPLVVFAHGGPTSATRPTYEQRIQFFTSRGIAVADVNYRGSTGYGRAYREALYGTWGVMDVEDCIDAARYVADVGQVDGERMAIRGGSAGGFIVLAALAFHDDFAGGASYFGVADLERLADLTHKFESHYLDQLIGPYPDDADTYEARSPVHHASGIDVPVLLLQGEDDPVVPLAQAQDMVEALNASGVPHELIVFADEQHGFRKADSRKRAHEAELAFYGEIFDFEPADDLVPVDLSPVDGR